MQRRRRGIVGRLAAAALVVAAAGSGPVGFGIGAAPAGAGPLGNRSPFVPALLDPPDGAVVPRNSGQSFTVNAVDPDGDTYKAVVTVRRYPSLIVAGRFESLQTVSGANARVDPVPPLVEGEYVWSAHAEDLYGGVGPESGYRRLTVVGPIDIGAGVVAGWLHYAGGGVLPGTCGSSSFAVDASSGFAVVNLAITAYAGPLTVRGTGTSPCEDAVLGAGPLSLDVGGTGPTGSELSCVGLSGSWVRAGAVVTASVSGTCLINGFRTPKVVFTLAGSAVSFQPGGGVLVPMTDAVLDGVVAVTPG